MNKEELQSAIKNALVQNDFQQLEQLCEIAVKENLTNSDPEILYAFASLELHKMNEEKALEYLDRSLELSDQFKPALELRAFVNKNLQNEEEALEDINKLIILDPESTHWKLMRIDLNKSAENREDVEADFNFLIKKYPLDIDFRDDLGEYYMEISEYQESIYCFSDVIDIEKKLGITSFHPFLKRGNAYLNNGDFVKAIDDFKSVLKMTGEEADAYYGLACCAHSLHKPEQAIAYLDLGLDMVVNNRCLLYQKKAEIAKELQNWDEVETAYKGMTRDIRGKAEGFYQLGLLYLRQGEKELAFEMLREAENNFHEKAEDMILTHCQEFLQSDKKSEEKDLIDSFADDFVKNADSPILKNTFGKLWKLDENKTIHGNTVLNNLPAEMRDKILETFSSMLVRISPKGIYIFNLGQEDSRAIYSIDEERGDLVSIQMLRFDSSESQTMNLKSGENYLILSNFGGSKTNLDLHFIPCNLKDLSAMIQKNYAEKERAGYMEFL